MKICVVVSSLGVGGTEKAATELVNHWARTGWDVTLITLTGREATPYVPLDPGVTLCPLDVARPSSNLFEALSSNLSRVFRLHRVLRSARPDAVVSFGDRTNVVTLLSSIGLSMLVIVSDRSNPFFNLPGRPWAAMQRLLYPFATAIVLQTSGAASFFGVRLQSKITIIPNAAPDYGNLSAKRGSKTIVSAGRLVEYKAVDTVLHAFALVVRQHPEWRLHIWGSGPEREHLEQLTQLLGIPHQVSFMGASQTPQGWVGDGEIFVFASRYEGFPNVLLEAMRAGFAVVSTDCPWGPRDLIRSGTDGLLIPVDDVNALAASLVRLIDDPNLREQLAEAATSSVKRFDSDIIFAQWERLIRARLSPHRRSLTIPRNAEDQP